MIHVHIPNSNGKDGRYDAHQIPHIEIIEYTDNISYALFPFKNKERHYIFRRNETGQEDNLIFEEVDNIRILYNLLKGKKIITKKSSKFTIYIHWGGIDDPLAAEDMCKRLKNSIENKIKKIIEIIPYSTKYNQDMGLQDDEEIGEKDSKKKYSEKVFSLNLASELYDLKIQLMRHLFPLSLGQRVQEFKMSGQQFSKEIKDYFLESIKNQLDEIITPKNEIKDARAEGVNQSEETKKIGYDLLQHIYELRECLNSEIDKHLKKAGNKAVYD